MEVIAESPNQMTLRLRPWFLWIFGGVFASAGLAVAVLGAQIHTFNCRRHPNLPANCQISNRGLFWSNQQVVPLTDIQGSKIKTFKDKKGNVSYRVVLLTTKGEVFVIPENTADAATVKTWMQNINNFLKDSQQQEVSITEDYRWSVYLFGGLFACTGLGIAGFLGKITTCKIDKTLGQLNLENRGLFSSSQTEYRIRDLRGVTVEKSFSSKGKPTSRITLILESGERIPFTSYYSSEFQQHQQTADRIRQFLNLESISEVEQPNSLQEVFTKFQDVMQLALMNQEKREAKLAQLRQAMMSNPDDPEIAYEYGFALYAFRRHDEAKPILEQTKRLLSLKGEMAKVYQIDSLLKSLSRDS
jgi:hypothetical protein